MMTHTAAVLWLAMSVLAIPAPRVLAEQQLLSNREKRAIVSDMYADYKRNSFPGVPDISPREAMSLLQSGDVVFVDVRKSAEMEVSMLPHAVTREAFLENIDQYREHTIVAYCTISYRSGHFARDMAESGVMIHNLEGGILAWLLDGGRVFKDGEETRRVHVYGDRWDYAPSGYETVKFGFLRQLF